MLLLVALVVILILVYFAWYGRGIHFEFAGQPIPMPDNDTAKAMMGKYPHIMEKDVPARVQDVYTLWNNGCITDAQARLFLGGTRAVPVVQRRGNTKATAVRGFGFRLNYVGVLDIEDKTSMAKFIATIYGDYHHNHVSFAPADVASHVLIVGSDEKLPKNTCYFSMYELSPSKKLLDPPPA